MILDSPPRPGGCFRSILLASVMWVTGCRLQQRHLQDSVKLGAGLLFLVPSSEGTVFLSSAKAEPQTKLSPCLPFVFLSDVSWWMSVTQAEKPSTSSDFRISLNLRGRSYLMETWTSQFLLVSATLFCFCLWLFHWSEWSFISGA